MSTRAGPAEPAAVVADRAVRAGPAQPVVAMTAATLDRAALAGTPVPVVDVTADVDAGLRGLAAGPAVPMVARSGAEAVVQGGPALPVYIVSGSFTPPTPPAGHLKRGMKIGLTGAYTYAKDT